MLLALRYPNKHKSYIKLILCILIANVPIAVTGFTVLIYDLRFKNTTYIALSLIIFGIIMGLIDHYYPKNRRLSDIKYSHALIIGLFNAFAAIPGASRLGCCLTGGRFLGYNRQDCLRFSFLLSIPPVIGASIANNNEILTSRNF